MPLARWTIAIATTFVGMMSLQVGAMAQQDVPPLSCHVTLPSSHNGVPSSSFPAITFGIGTNAKVAVFGTDHLWTVLPIDGAWRGFRPAQPGVSAYSDKLPWGGTFSGKDGPPNPA